MSSTRDLIDQQMEEWFRSALPDQTPREMTLEDVPGMERPMSSGPNDIAVGRDELGRTIYETPTGQRYSVGVNPDQRTANRRFKEDMLPAIRGWIKDPKLPSREQVGQFAQAAAREMADSLERTVASEGTMGEALSWAGAGITSAPRAVSAGVRAATPDRIERLRELLIQTNEREGLPTQVFRDADADLIQDQAYAAALYEAQEGIDGDFRNLFTDEELDDYLERVQVDVHRGDVEDVGEAVTPDFNPNRTEQIREIFRREQEERFGPDNMEQWDQYTDEQLEFRGLDEAARFRANGIDHPVRELFTDQELDDYEQRITQAWEDPDLDDLEDVDFNFEYIDDLEITGEGIRPAEYQDLIRRPGGAPVPISPSYGLDVDSTDFITPRGETTLVQPGQAFVYNPLFAIIEDMQISPKGIKGATLMKMLEKHPVYRRGLLEGTGIRFNPEQRYSQQEILDLLHQNTNPLFIRERSPEWSGEQRQNIGREIDYNEITLEAFPDSQGRSPVLLHSHWYSDGAEPLAHSRYTVSEVDGKPIIVVDELQADSLRTDNMDLSMGTLTAEEMIEKYNIPENILQDLRIVRDKYEKFGKSNPNTVHAIFTSQEAKNFDNWARENISDPNDAEIFFDQYVAGIVPTKPNVLMGDADYVRPLLGYTIMDAYERGIDEIFIPDSVAIGAKRGITDHDSLQRFRALYDKAVPKVLKQLSRELDIEFEPYTIRSSDFDYDGPIVQDSYKPITALERYYKSFGRDSYKEYQKIFYDSEDAELSLGEFIRKLQLNHSQSLPENFLEVAFGTSGYRVRITGEIPQGDIRFNKGGLVTREKLYAT